VNTKVFVANKIGGDLVVCRELRSLTVATDNPTKCAVAPNGTYAAVWDTVGGEISKINTDNYGSVHSVEWFNSSDHLLIGSGFYPLGTETPQARIELWRITAQEQALLGAVALPGVCADTIARPDDDDEFVCFSGLRNQKQGFLCVADANSLRPKAFHELPFAGVSRIECVGDLVFMSNGAYVRAIRKEDGREKWVRDLGTESADFARDSENEDLLLLSDGTMVTVGNARVVEQLPALKGCCAVAALPDGGFVGVSTDGVIGIWQG
jgi:hypothetical protein